jgi:hypothetical protein
MATITYLVDVDVEHETGKFASRDEISEVLQEAIQSAIEEADLNGLGMDGTSEYTIANQELVELTRKDQKEIWDDAHVAVVQELPGDAELRAENKRLREEAAKADARLASLQEDVQRLLSERNNGVVHSRVSVDNWRDRSVRYLKDDARVKFHFGYMMMREYIAVTLKDDELEIYGTESIVLTPQSGNVVCVSLKGH